MKQGVDEVKETVRATARDLKHQARDAAEQARRRATERATEYGSAQKQRFASCLSDVGAALRSACETLRERQDDTLAGWTETLAAQVEDAGRSLENRSGDDLLASLEGVARRRPELVLGGMFLAGIGLARFFKSSARHELEHDTTSQYSPATPSGSFAGEGATTFAGSSALGGPSGAGATPGAANVPPAGNVGVTYGSVGGAAPGEVRP